MIVSKKSTSSTFNKEEEIAKRSIFIRRIWTTRKDFCLTPQEWGEKYHCPEMVDVVQTKDYPCISEREITYKDKNGKEKTTIILVMSFITSNGIIFDFDLKKKNDFTGGELIDLSTVRIMREEFPGSDFHEYAVGEEREDEDDDYEE